MPTADRSLTPEEDALPDPDDTADEIDDTLPADLWFRRHDADRRPPVAVRRIVGDRVTPSPRAAPRLVPAPSLADGVLSPGGASSP